ncbi:MAG: hypothetical protein WD928_16480 [Gammaproteobacteria bacterium]
MPRSLVTRETLGHEGADLIFDGGVVRLLLAVVADMGWHVVDDVQLRSEPHGDEDAFMSCQPAATGAYPFYWRRQF